MTKEGRAKLLKKAKERPNLVKTYMKLLKENILRKTHLP